MSCRRRYVDLIAVAAYLGLTLAACVGAPGPIVPVGSIPASAGDALAWIAQTRLMEPTLHRFRWQFRDPRGSAGGRGSARVTPGDSLRLDMVGPLGTGRGAAFVVGDSARWAEPEEEVGKILPNYPLLWAMVGIARMPVPLGEVSRFEDAKVTAWRFVFGADTVEYARLVGPPLRFLADVRQSGKRLGRVVTEYTPAGMLKSSRVDVPSVPARLDITYVSSTTTSGFPPDTWLPPQR